MKVSMNQLISNQLHLPAQIEKLNQTLISSQVKLLIQEGVCSNTTSY